MWIFLLVIRNMIEIYFYFTTVTGEKEESALDQKETLSKEAGNSRNDCTLKKKKKCDLGNEERLINLKIIADKQLISIVL